MADDLLHAGVWFNPRSGRSYLYIDVAGTGARWCEAAKNVSTPSKRRRNRYDDDDEEEDEEEEIKDVDSTVRNKLKSNRSAASSSAVRKRGRGGGAGAVLEGSRCSRVNGRGWRCCQPTLVGYSLCEHHLGKGRLRSMTNVRGRRQTKPPTAPVVLGSSRAMKEEPKEGEEEEEEEEEEDVDGVDEEEAETKPGATKLGAVKARSMSSLLGQDSNRNPNSSSATPTSTTIVIAMEAAGSGADVKEHSP